MISCGISRSRYSHLDSLGKCPSSKMLWVLTVRKGEERNPLALAREWWESGPSQWWDCLWETSPSTCWSGVPHSAAASFLSVFLVLSFADVSYLLPLTEPIILSRLFLRTNAVTPWGLFSKIAIESFDIVTSRSVEWVKFNDFPFSIHEM